MAHTGRSRLTWGVKIASESKKCIVDRTDSEHQELRNFCAVLTARCTCSHLASLTKKLSKEYEPSFRQGQEFACPCLQNSLSKFLQRQPRPLLPP